MTNTLIVAIIVMTTALILYTSGVWSEKFAGQLKARHLIFFWFGLIADTTGTTMMGKIAGGFSLNLHSLTGLTAILLMLFHTIWATIIVLQKNRKLAHQFHRFSIPVWGVWLLSFCTGLYLAMF